MNNLIEQIKKVGEDDINDVVETAVQRYNELFPKWEIQTVSILKSEDRVEQINRAICVLETLKRWRPRESGRN